MTPKLPIALILKVAAALLLALLLVLTLQTCQKNRSLKDQAKIDKAQTSAAIESGKDASNTQAAVATNDTAAFDVGRENAKEIRNAKGADVAVDPAVAAARLNGLCRRPAYHNDPACRVQQPR